MQTEWNATPKGDYSTQVKFNQYGFRDVKDLRNSKDTDWFAVGDSYTMGFGVDEDKRFSNLLEKELQAGGDHTCVYNIGMPGNFIDYQRLLKYAESRGAKIHHLIVGVCMDNDLEDYTDRKSDWDKLAQEMAGYPLKVKLRRWLRGHSALYTDLTFMLQKSPVSRVLMEKIGLASDVNVEHDFVKEEWSETILRTSREELIKLTAKRDALILIIPTRRLWYGSNPQINERNHTVFVKQCRDSGLNVVDLSPVFAANSDPLGFYFAHDPHWSPRGHATAAQELFKAIKNHHNN